MSSIVAIRNEVKNILDALKVSSGKIEFIYDYFESECEGYPSITFESSTVENTLESNAQEQEVVEFRIVIHQACEKN